MTDVQAKIGVTATGWTFTGVAIALTCCRYVVRVRLVDGLQLDDLLHGLALLGTIAFMCIDTISLQQQYFSTADMIYYERLAISSSILGFVVVIYLVKFAFLMMYRNIFRVSATFMLAWKLTCALNVICFLAGLLSYFWLCGSPYQTVHLEYCQTPVASLPRVVEVMTVACLLNSLSSIAVMALPLSMLRTLQIRSAGKLGLAAIFLLAVADLIFDITRTITTLKLVSNVLETMASLEPSVAVIASALAALGPVLRHRSGRKGTSYEWTSDRSDGPSHGSHRSESLPTYGMEVAGDARKGVRTIREVGALRTVAGQFVPQGREDIESNGVRAEPRYNKALPPEPRPTAAPYTSWIKDGVATPTDGWWD